MRSVTLPAKDGYPLAARVFGADAEGVNVERVIIIHPATAVAQRFYAPFAEELAIRGAVVVTYDYRGIAESRPKGTPFRKFKATMMDWAGLDADGVHAWVGREFPKAKVCVVGHSFGGQMLGLLEHRDRIHRALLVAAQMGYWRYFPLRSQPLMLFYWYFLFPIFVATLGYVPMKRMGAGEDLPGGVASQWRRWCTLPDYLFSDLDEKTLGAYREFPAPILAFGFTDDDYAGPIAVERLLEHFCQDRVKLVKIAPGELGVRAIGHLGFFRKQFRENLWKQALDWLEGG